jgi:hypothetical protein
MHLRAFTTLETKRGANRLFGVITWYLVIIWEKCLIFHPQPRKFVPHLIHKIWYFDLIFRSRTKSLRFAPRIWSRNRKSKFRGTFILYKVS